MEKTEEQIEKDKAAVASMKGAKSAMEAALRRIEYLEATLRLAREDAASVSKCFGESAHFKVFHQGDWRVRSAKDIFADIDNRIRAAL